MAPVAPLTMSDHKYIFFWFLSMGALPCTPQFILLLVHQMLCIRRSFCNFFLSTSVFLTPNDFVLSPLHLLALQDHLGACWTAQSCPSPLAISPLMGPDLFSLRETPSEGSILEIPVHDFFCITFTQMLRERQEIGGGMCQIGRAHV